jgi:hypothetical protein
MAPVMSANVAGAMTRPAMCAADVERMTGQPKIGAIGAVTGNPATLAVVVVPMMLLAGTATGGVVGMTRRDINKP